MSDSPTHAERLERLWQAYEDDGPAAAAQIMGDLFHPDIEFSPLLAGNAGGGTYRGRDGMQAFFGELHEAFDEVRYEPPQFHQVGEDTVIVFTRMVGLARDTGLPLRQDLPLIYEFTDEGQVRCVTAYESPAEALEAAQRGHADA